MPAPEPSGPWLRCAPVCGDGTPLQSLTTLEEQLETSFGLLKQRLAEVREEVEMNGRSQVATNSLFVPDVDVGRELAEDFGGGEHWRDLSGFKMKLEVPAALSRGRIDLKDFASRSASMAGDRASSVAQAVDLVTMNTGQQPLRLHGRWMEMVNRGDQMLTARKGKRLIGNSRRTVEVEKAKEENEDDGSVYLRDKGPQNVLLPHQPFRLTWDMGGLFLILVDAVGLPLSLAWDVPIQPKLEDVGTWINCFTFFTALLFWSIDIIIQFNTGFYHNGRLVLSRRRIALQYLKTWLIFDILLISLDVATAIYQFGMSQSAGAALLRSIRALRVLRAFRLLRLLKMSRLSAVIEEASIAAGRQWLVLVVAIVNTTLTILICAHVLTCIWFWIGRDRIEAGQISWLQLSEAENIPGPIQYMHALQWILVPPSPLLVAPDSAFERVYCIFLQGCTVAIIGSSLSKITGTLTELRTINSEGSRRRREVRQYLHAQKVSMELTSRIMRFVDYKLERQSSVALDPSLLSPSLRTELHVSQRGHMLRPHPLFELTFEIFPEVFALICGAVEKQVFGKMETVFQIHSWAECMWITGTGSFMVLASDPGFDLDDLTVSRSVTVAEQTETIAGGHWFTEAACFAEAVTHDCSLRAMTFAEAFTLKGEDLARTLMNSPDCTALYCEYGKDLLSRMTVEKSKETWSYAKAEELSKNSLRQNSYFQEVHPDPKTVLNNVNLFKEVVYFQAFATARATGIAEVKRFFTSTHSRFKAIGRRGKSLFYSSNDLTTAAAVAQAPVQEELPSRREVRDPEEEVYGTTSSVTAEESYKKAKEQLNDLAEGLLKKKVRISEAAGSLSDSLPELMPGKGTHDVFGQALEREKSESCCISLMALLVGSYQDYTLPQAEQAKLSESQWQQLQGLVQWTQPTASMIRSALVLLAIRALGKSKRILQQLPPSYHRPESAVIYLMRSYPDVVPSVKALEETDLELMAEALEVHKDFNLAQMLQGENVPASVFQLQEVIKRLGMEIFRFYILFLLGFMSGLAGGKGSRFMNARNASSVIAGMTTLLHILDSSPEAIYWSFIELRGKQLKLPCSTPEDMALVRLACLARVQDQKGFQSLRQSWELLGLRERNTLARHLLADGINEQAYVCEFLPDCVAKARDNRHIGLPLLLEVLVNLVEHLHEVEITPNSNHQGVKMVTVDLSDMSEFIPICQNRFIFSTCISRAKIKMENSRWHLQMTSANWSRTHEPDSDTTTLAYGVQELLQRQKFMQEILASTRKDP